MPPSRFSRNLVAGLQRRLVLSFCRVVFFRSEEGQQLRRVAFLSTLMAIIVIASATLRSQIASAQKPFLLDIIWSAPIIAPPPAPVGVVVGPELGTGLVLVADTLSSDGRTIFVGRQLAQKSSSQVLLIDSERRGPQSAQNLVLTGTPFDAHRGVTSNLLLLLTARIQKTPGIVSIAAGPGDEIWVGGGVNFYRDIASAPHGDAYLAKLDVTGRVIWEKSYGNGDLRSIQSMAALPTGDVAVIGPEGHDAMWLARVDSDGRRLWERRIGNGLGAAVAALADGRLVVVGFAAAEPGPTSEDRQISLTAWIVDATGQILTKTRIRTDLDFTFADIAIRTTQDAVYVASGSHSSRTSPVEISKLALDGALLWRKTLSDTVVIKNIFTRVTCSAALAIAPTGDIWVACSLSDQIQLYRLDPYSGEYEMTLLALPDCHEGRPAAKLFLIMRGGEMLLGGSRPSNNSRSSCSWIGRLVASR
jgi:hypothetical protein